VQGGGMSGLDIPLWRRRLIAAFLLSLFLLG
jgi:hypothetical protein